MADAASVGEDAGSIHQVAKRMLAASTTLRKDAGSIRHVATLIDSPILTSRDRTIAGVGLKMAFLTVEKGSMPGTILELHAERVVLGRHPNCEIVLENAAVSRHHAQILASDGHYFIEDLRSRNATRINGMPITGRSALQDGDEIAICDVTFRFCLNVPLDAMQETLDLAVADSNAERAESATLQDEFAWLARSLKSSHVHYTGNWLNEIQAELLAEHSDGSRLLSEGFFRTVVIDTDGGQDESGTFNMDTFLRHVRRRMAESFGHDLDETLFHPEQIAQVLKDEEQSLFCFINGQQLSESDLHRLRGLGFSQEQHRVMYCGANEYLGTKSLPVNQISSELVLPGDANLTAVAGRVQGIRAFEMDSSIRTDSDSDSNLRIEVKSEIKLNAILSITKVLGRTLDREAILDKVLDELFRIFAQADEGFVLLKDSERNKLLVQATKSRRDDDEPSVHISMTIVKQAMQDGKAIVSADAVKDSRFELSESLTQLQIRSILCVPLLDQDDQAFGVIQIDTQDTRRQFSQNDLELMVAVAKLTSMSLENAQLHLEKSNQRDLQRDLEFATQVQLGFLPQQPPEVPGFEIADFYEAALSVGGDFFDYIALPDGRVAISFGDVAGKGVPAALLMARMYSTSRLHLLTAPSVAEAMTCWNAEIAASGRGQQFVTGIMIVLDPQTNEAVIANAGHMAPIGRNVSGEMTFIGSEITGMPLGVVSDSEFNEVRFQFDRGDSLVLFTDGISETTDSTGEIYGLQRLSDFVATGPDSMQELVKAIVADVEEFSDGRPPQDDMCLVAIRRTE